MRETCKDINDKIFVIKSSIGKGKKMVCKDKAFEFKSIDEIFEQR